MENGRKGYEIPVKWDSGTIRFFFAARIRGSHRKDERTRTSKNLL
jgi:hypothetical protein